MPLRLTAVDTDDGNLRFRSPGEESEAQHVCSVHL